MARVRKKRVRWNPSADHDVAGYKLYWTIGEGVGYHSPFAEVGTRTEILLPDEVPSFPLVEGDVEIGITAVNHSGNESDMMKSSGPFNFASPAAPTGVLVEDV